MDEFIFVGVAHVHEIFKALEIDSNKIQNFIERKLHQNCTED